MKPIIAVSTRGKRRRAEALEQVGDPGGGGQDHRGRRPQRGLGEDVPGGPQARPRQRQPDHLDALPAARRRAGTRRTAGREPPPGGGGAGSRGAGARRRRRPPPGRRGPRRPRRPPAGWPPPPPRTAAWPPASPRGAGGAAALRRAGRGSGRGSRSGRLPCAGGPCRTGGCRRTGPGRAARVMATPMIPARPVLSRPSSTPVDGVVGQRRVGQGVVLGRLRRTPGRWRPAPGRRGSRRRSR